MRIMTKFVIDLSKVGLNVTQVAVVDAAVVEHLK